MNFEKLSNGLFKVADKIRSNIYVSAISDGLLSTMPLMMVGAIGSIINSLGIDQWQDFLITSGLKKFTVLPNEIGTNLLALFAVFAIGYRLAKAKKQDGITAGILSLMAFLFITPLSFGETGSMNAIPSQWLGPAGLFVAMIVGVLASRLYCLFVEKNIVIKMPEGVPPVIERTFGSILPAIAISVISIGMAYAFSLTDWESVHGFIYDVVSVPLTGLGSSFPALLIAVLFTHLFWSIGVHGTMVVLSIFMPLWAPLDGQNLAMFNMGEASVSIVSLQFFFLSAFVGGAGNTLGLIMNMLTSKVETNRTLGKLALVPGLFGINEPIIFGTPIVLNPLLMIPFILSPLVCTVLGYLVCSMGIIAAPTGVSSIAGAPVIVNQFLMAGVSWAIWIVVVLIISYFIYMPFFKLYEKKQLEEISENEQADKVESIGKEFEKATR